jgi:phage terminase small subunit
MATPRKGSRELFLKHYVANGCQNLGKAYAAAGFSGTRQSAYSMLQEPEMKARLAVLMGKQLDKLDITAERVMMELARIAFFDVRLLYDADGKMLKPNDLPPEATAALTAEFTCKRDDIRLRSADKAAALAILARHFKISGHEVDEAIGKLATFAERLAEARERERKLRK